jgi:hypothetical protein
MAVDDVYKVTISASGQGSVYQNVLNVMMKTEPDPTPVQFQGLITAFTNIFINQQSNTITYSSWEATQQWGPNMSIDAPRCRRLNAKQFGANISAKVGLAAFEALPPQNALVFTWLTGVAGRRKRGRNYVFGLTESDQVQGLFTSTVLTTWNTNMTTFLNLYRDDTGTDPTFTLGVWSERTASGCVPATAPAKGHVQLDPPHPELAFTPVTGGIVRDVVYSQRRRTRGVGR